MALFFRDAKQVKEESSIEVYDYEKLYGDFYAARDTVRGAPSPGERVKRRCEGFADEDGRA